METPKFDTFKNIEDLKNILKERLSNYRNLFVPNTSEARLCLRMNMDPIA